MLATATFALVLYQVLSVVRSHSAASRVPRPLHHVFCLDRTRHSECPPWLFRDLAIGGRAITRTPIHETPQLQQQRTALLFPVYNEDPARVAATIEAIATELIALGVGEGFDFFILSDSRTSEAKARELRAVRLLRRALPDDTHIYYRARSENIGKKAGNIADWVERFGGAYESFIILDADSVMSGTLIVHLAALMSSSPRTALI